MSDLELARKCAKGDKASWEEFTRRYSRLIYHSIRRVFAQYAPALLSHQEKIEDICHDIYIILIKDDCRALRTYQGRNGASLAGWLRQVVVHHAIDYLRRMTPVVSLDQENDWQGVPLLERLADPLPLGDVQAMRAESLQSLSACIELLDEESKFFLELMLSYRIMPEEMGALLGISRGAVDMRKCRIMEKLKECFRKKGYVLD